MAQPSRPHNGVTITNREIFDAVNDTRNAVRDLASEVKHLGQDVDRHESEIEDLKSRRWPLPAVAVLLSLTAVTFSLVMELT